MLGFATLNTGKIARYEVWLIILSYIVSFLFLIFSLGNILVTKELSSGGLEILHVAQIHEKIRAPLIVFGSGISCDWSMLFMLVILLVSHWQ